MIGFIAKAGFNPRTRVGCDGSSKCFYYDVVVSIHAPVWGATKEWIKRLESEIVSIHAPVWGATAGGFVA